MGLLLICKGAVQVFGMSGTTSINHPRVRLSNAAEFHPPVLIKSLPFYEKHALQTYDHSNFDAYFLHLNFGKILDLPG